MTSESLKPPYWRVVLEGRAVDLAWAVFSLSLPSLSVVVDGTGFYLIADEFEMMNGVGEITESADHLVAVMNGAGVLHLDNFESLRRGTVQRVQPDGSIVS